MLSRVVEENQRRDAELGPSSVRLQCLRCGSEFTRHGQGSGEEEEEVEEEEAGARGSRRTSVMLPRGEEEQDEEEAMEGIEDGKGEMD